MGGVLGESCRKYEVAYHPEQFSQKLGHACRRCQKSLSYERSLSPCRCYLFCHQECFAAAFAKHLRGLRSAVRCQQCQAHLQLVLKASYAYDPNPSLARVCRLGAAWVVLMAVVVLLVVSLQGLEGQYIFLAAYLEGLLLSLVVYWVAVCFRELFFRQDIAITEVGSTKLDIQTSAFQDLDMETHDELTSQALKGSAI